MFRHCAFALVALALVSAPVAADAPVVKPTIKDQLERAKKNASAQTYELRYKFAADETIRWTVTHLVTVDTKIRGVTQTAKSRSVSTKEWKVEKVDSDGNATLVHRVPQVDMWQQVSGRQEVRYNSVKDATPPLEYAQLAKSVGTPLTTFQVNRHGVLLNRHDDRSSANIGFGALIIPLPAQAVKVGDSWSVPQDVLIRLESGEVKTIKTRDRYVLAKVEASLATIEAQTQVLTPVDDPQIQAQLVQRLTKGAIKFDIADGRVISKQMDLDESVLGFSGADSLMQYLARFTEQLDEGKETKPAAAPAAATPTSEAPAATEPAAIPAAIPAESETSAPPSAEEARKVQPSKAAK